MHSAPSGSSTPWCGRAYLTILRYSITQLRARTDLSGILHDRLTESQTGAGTTASLLGMPDLALISFNEMHDNARMIASLASSDPKNIVPVIADADTGFGSPLNVARTTAAYITSNVAALHIEDQSQHKRCGHLNGKQLVDTEEFISRIRAAAVTREKMGRDIVIIARTDCLQQLGFEEAIIRLKLAVDAGADVAFIEGIPDYETGKRMCQALAPTPVLCNVVAGGLTPEFSKEEAQGMGVKVVIDTAFALGPVYGAVTEAAEELMRTGRPQKREGNGKIRDVFDVCGMEECIEIDNICGGGMLDKNGI